MRPLPELTPANAWFWTSGADGTLRMQGCDDCSRLVHPPVPDLPLLPQPVLHADCGIGPRDHCRFHGQPPPLASRASTPPYVIANVALVEDPHVHLTTNIVGCEPSEVEIGHEVAVRFEQQEDVWLPLFELTGAIDPVDRVQEPARPIPRAPLSEERFEHRAVLSGIGRSRFGRRLMVDPLSLAVDASLEAIADAGLTLDDIDGLSTYPGAGGGGMSEGGASAIEEALRLHPTWINGGGDLPGPGGAVIAAAMAVASGLCRHVLCFRTVWESTFATLAAQATPSVPAPAATTSARRVSGPFQEWRAPFRRHVRRQLDRHERHPVPAPLRGAPRDARVHRGQRTARTPP